MDGVWGFAHLSFYPLCGMYSSRWTVRMTFDSGKGARIWLLNLLKRILYIGISWQNEIFLGSNQLFLGSEVWKCREILLYNIVFKNDVYIN